MPNTSARPKKKTLNNWTEAQFWQITEIQGWPVVMLIFVPRIVGRNEISTPNVNWVVRQTGHAFKYLPTAVCAACCCSGVSATSVRLYLSCAVVAHLRHIVCHREIKLRHYREAYSWAP
jgi:hypothetical protein